MTERFRELQLRFSFLMKAMQSTSDFRERQTLMLETRKVLEEAYAIVDRSVAEARYRAESIEKRVRAIMAKNEKSQKQKQKQRN